MGWFVPTGRTEHPCLLPSKEEQEQHRPGEFWRCQVCGALWKLDDSPWHESEFYRVLDVVVRWRYRKEGYGSFSQRVH